ncbi:MAG: hypothetical protein ACLP8S_30635 [Solirubrobacteraceae bacterium]
MALEMRDEPREHLQLLVGVEDLSLERRPRAQTVRQLRTGDVAQAR